MQFNKRWFLPVLMVVTLLLVACGGAAATPTPAAEDTTAAPTTATDSSGDGEAAVATKAPAATKVTEEPTKEAAEPTEAATDDSSDANTEVGSVESVEGINSYRFTMEIVASGEAFESDDNMTMAMMGGGVTIEGAVVKEPPAQNVEISLGGEPAFGFRIVDGASYTSFGGEWVQSEDSEAPVVDDFLPVTPEEISNMLDKVERIGNEDVDGRPATRYRANKEQLAEIAASQGDNSEFDFADADEAGLDFWVDEEIGFISKMDLMASGKGLNEDNPELEGNLELHIEYTDVNEDIEIEAPEISTTLPDLGGTVTDTTTTTDTDTTPDTDIPDISMGDTVDAVNTLVGFDLGLPEDAEVYIFGDYASIVVEMTAEETNTLLADGFEANGYTLNEDASFADAGLFQYDRDDAKWSVITSESSGTTTIIISPVTE